MNTRESNYTHARYSRYLRQFLFHFHNWRNDENFHRIVRGRQLREAWISERSRQRWNRRHPEESKPPPYKPPTTEQGELDETMALFTLAEQHGMGAQLSALCLRMRKLGRDDVCDRAEANE